MLYQQRILYPEQKLINKSNCLILCGLIVSSGHNCTDFIHIELNASEQVCVRGFRLHVLFSVKCSGYQDEAVCCHTWVAISPLSMICDLVLSHHSLLVTAQWLRALPLFLSLPLPASLLVSSSLTLSLSLSDALRWSSRAPSSPF